LRNAIVFLLSGFLLALAGCGSVSTNSLSVASPTPTPVATPTPIPTPTPSPTPIEADAFSATIFLEQGRNPSPIGSITLDTTVNDGTGKLQFIAIGEPNTTLVLQFCPYPQGFNGCSNVTSLTTDAIGSADITFKFPQNGTFSGIFQLLQTNTAQLAATATGSSGTSFQSALLPAATVSGGVQQITGNAPGSGRASMNGTTAHITLTGTIPNHTFNTAVCSLFLQTACLPLADVTTDALGNANTDVGTVQPAGLSIFRVSDINGVQFVTAFRVQ